MHARKQKSNIHEPLREKNGPEGFSRQRDGPSNMKGKMKSGISMKNSGSAVPRSLPEEWIRLDNAFRASRKTWSILLWLKEMRRIMMVIACACSGSQPS